MVGKSTQRLLCAAARRMASVMSKTAAPQSESKITKPSRRHNKSFDETHARLTDVAVRIFSEKGEEGLSISAVARESGMNRTTVYYHFNSRDEMVEAVRKWSAGQLAKAFAPIGSPGDRARYISTFVLEKPELMKLWVDDFMASGDIRDRYPEWDNLVEGTRKRIEREQPGSGIDAEVYCTIMLTVAMVAPRVFANSVRPEMPMSDIIERFTREQMRALDRDALGETKG